MDRYLPSGSQLVLKGEIYEIQEIVGQGSSCVVYYARRDNGHGIYTEHLLKEYNPMHLTVSRSDQGVLLVEDSQRELFEDGLRRFQTGYERQSQIRQIDALKNATSNIQALYEANGTQYINMTCFHGRTYDKVEEKSLYELLRRLKAVTRIIGDYHRLGLLHLDIKPVNIFTIPETCELVMLFDFDSVVEKTQIQTAGLSYTKSWAAPEQLRPDSRRKISEASDLFALGEIAFYQIMGRHSQPEDRRSFSTYSFPFESPLFRNVDAKIDPYLTNFFRHTICVTPQKRYASAEEMIAALDSLIRMSDPNTPQLQSSLGPSMPFFVGREQELNEIHERLSHSNTLFLRGIGGIGKSELANQYAHRYESEYDTVIFARCADTLENMFFSDQNVPIANLTTRQPEETVAAYSRRKRSCFRNCCTARTLLIIDNLNDADDPLLAEILKWDCTVLITTRVDFSEYNQPQLEIDVLKNQLEIEEIFQNNCQRTLDEAAWSAVRELIAMVDGHTMAVELLAKQVKASDLEPEDLLERMRERGIRETGREKIRSGKDGVFSRRNAFGHIRALFDVAKLDMERQMALMNMSLLPYTGISKRKLRIWCGWEDFEVLNWLIESGWAKEDLSGMTSLHPLVAEVAYEQLREQPESCLPFLVRVRKYLSSGQKKLTAAQRQEDAIILDTAAKRGIALIAEDRVRKQMSRTQLRSVARFLSAVPSALTGFGHVNCCIQCRKQALELFEHVAELSDSGDELHADQKQIAHQLDGLGGLYLQKGKLNTAEEYLLRALNILKNADPEFPYDIARSYANLGTVYRKLQKIEDAEKYYRKALQIFHKCQNKSQETTTLSNLGLLYSERGDFSAAFDCYQEALAIQRDSPSKQEPLSAVVWTNLGALYAEKYQYEKAREMYELAERSFSEWYGEENWKLAAVLHNLGSLHKNIGQNGEAVAYYEKALSIRRKIYGENYPDTISSYSGLGALYLEKGNYAVSEHYYRTAYDSSCGLYGNESPQAAEILSNMGLLYQSKGELSIAKDHILSAKAIYERLYLDKYPDHPVLAGIYDTLSGLLELEGSFSEAESYLQMSLKIYKRSYGEHHPKTAYVKKRLSALYFEDGDPELAVLYMQQAHSDYLEWYGEEDVHLASILASQGNLYLKCGDFASAKKCCEKALVIYRNTYGEESRSIIVYVLDLLANAQKKLGEVSFAEKTYLQALKMCRDLYDQAHTSLAAILNNLGLLYYDGLHDYVQAKEYCTQALEMNRSLFGEQSRHTAINYGHLGLVYAKLGDFSCAEEFCKKNVEIICQIFGEDHIQSAGAFHRLGLVYVEEKNIPAARSCLSKALAIRQEALGQSHPDTEKVQADLNDLNNLT